MASSEKTIGFCSVSAPFLIRINGLAQLSWRKSLGGQISQINTLRSRNRSVGRESQFLANLIRSLSALQILPYTDEAEQLYQSWTAKQKRVGPNDCRIAASAILAGFTVITCNGKDFSAIPGVAWQDWSQP